MAHTHTAAPGDSGGKEPGCRKKRNQFEAALKELEVAHGGPQRAFLRALESVRAAIDLELRDFRRARIATKAPTDRQLRRLEQNLAQAWQAYEATSPGTETSLRALQGVRESEKALKQAQAKLPEPPVPPAKMQVMLADGTPLGEPVDWPTDLVPASGKIELRLPTGRDLTVQQAPDYVEPVPGKSNGNGSW